jgi:hypothetical protein
MVLHCSSFCLCQNYVKNTNTKLETLSLKYLYFSSRLAAILGCAASYPNR